MTTSCASHWETWPFEGFPSPASRRFVRHLPFVPPLWFLLQQTTEVVVLIALLSNSGLSSNIGPGDDSSATLDTSREAAAPAPRQRQVRLTAAQVDELVAAYGAGSSVRELVEQFGVHRTTVLDHLKRRGVPRRPNVRKLTDEQVQEAAEFYRAGNSLVTTGKRFGVDAATVAREFARHAIATRSKPQL